MANNFMTESFWDEPGSWRCAWRHGKDPDTGTLREAWNLAVERLAGHLVARKLRPDEESERAARDFLEEAAESMLKFSPGSEKRDMVEQLAETYLSSADPEWTMAVDSLLRGSVARGETNQHPQAPSNIKKNTPKGP